MNPNILHHTELNKVYKLYGRTEVVSVDASGDIVKIKAGDGTKKFDTGRAYPVKTTLATARGYSLFCFVC